MVSKYTDGRSKLILAIGADDRQLKVCIWAAEIRPAAINSTLHDVLIPHTYVRGGEHMHA